MVMNKITLNSSTMYIRSISKMFLHVLGTSELEKGSSQTAECLCLKRSPCSRRDDTSKYRFAQYM